MLNADLRGSNVFLAELCRVLPVQMNPVPFPVAETWESGWERTLWQQGRILGLDGQLELQRHNGSEISPVH